MVRHIDAARRAQLRQSQLIREALTELVSRHEFTAEIRALAETLRTLEEIVELQATKVEQRLGEILDKLP
jgi:hypothetical protein